MKLQSNRSPVVAVIAALGILLAGVFLWKQYQKTLPNAIYADGSSDRTPNGGENSAARASDGSVSNTESNPANRIRARKSGSR